MQTSYEIATTFKKENIEVIRNIKKKNINAAIDDALIDISNLDVSIAVWFEPDMKYGEIIVLDDQFQEEQLIKITER